MKPDDFREGEGLTGIDLALNGDGPTYRESRFTATSPDPSTFRLVRWLWDGLIPAGKFVGLVADEGTGKGLLLAWVAARITRGELPGHRFGEPSTVLFLADEDAVDDTVGPRLQAAGADFSKIKIVDPAADGESLILPRHVDELVRLTDEHDACVTILDPILEFLDSKVDDFRPRDVRHAMKGARNALAERDRTLICSFHTNKSSSERARDRQAGSPVFRALSRVTLDLVHRPQDGEDTRLLGATKMNLGKRRRAVKLTLGDGEARTGLGLPMKIGCVLAVEDSDVHPDDLLRRPERDAPERNRAEAYLSLMLSDGEWRSVAKLSKGAEAEGINLRTLQRAADALDIETRTVGFPGDHQWRHVQSRQRADVVTGENASHDTSPVSQQADVTTAEDTP